MSLWRRIGSVFKQKTNAALDKLEDPVEALEYAYAQQQEVLARVRESVTEVVTAEKRLEMEAQRLALAAERHREEARNALQLADDGAARIALTRAENAALQHDGLRLQLADVHAQRERLETTYETLRLRIDAFRAEKQALRAQYVAAQASTRAGEALGSLTGDVGEIRAMVERAKDRALELRARSEAIAELFAQGTFEGTAALPPATPAGVSRIVSPAAPSIEAQLAEMKRALAPPPNRALPEPPGD